MAAVTVVVVLILHYQLSSTDREHRASWTERRRRQHISRVTMMHNYSIGLVWPRHNDNDNDNDIYNNDDNEDDDDDNNDNDNNHNEDDDNDDDNNDDNIDDDDDDDNDNNHNEDDDNDDDNNDNDNNDNDDDDDNDNNDNNHNDNDNNNGNDDNEDDDDNDNNHNDDDDDIVLVWPRNDADDVDDRIASQIDVMNVYARQQRNRRIKVILRVGNFNFDNWVAGQEQFVRDQCPITSCWMTNDQSQARDADALLISEFSDSSRHLYLPKPLRQVWIAQHWESPLHNRIDAKSVRGLINWTASYRHDSTVVFRYGKLAPGAPASVAVTSGEELVNYADGKTKLVAWFVSNCKPGNQRMRYALELSRFIQVCRETSHYHDIQ